MTNVAKLLQASYDKIRHHTKKYNLVKQQHLFRTTNWGHVRYVSPVIKPAKKS